MRGVGWTVGNTNFLAYIIPARGATDVVKHDCFALISDKSYTWILCFAALGACLYGEIRIRASRLNVTVNWLIPAPHNESCRKECNTKQHGKSESAAVTEDGTTPGHAANLHSCWRFSTRMTGMHTATMCVRACGITLLICTCTFVVAKVCQDFMRRCEIVLALNSTGVVCCLLLAYRLSAEQISDLKKASNEDSSHWIRHTVIAGLWQWLKHVVQAHCILWRGAL